MATSQFKRIRANNRWFAISRHCSRCLGIVRDISVLFECAFCTLIGRLEAMFIGTPISNSGNTEGINHLLLLRVGFFSHPLFTLWQPQTHLHHPLCVTQLLITNAIVINQWLITTASLLRPSSYLLSGKLGSLVRGFTEAWRPAMSNSRGVALHWFHNLRPVPPHYSRSRWRIRAASTIPIVHRSRTTGQTINPKCQLWFRNK